MSNPPPRQPEGATVIIDFHCHLGSCRVFDIEISKEALKRAMDANGIDPVVVQPFRRTRSCRGT